MMGEDLDFLRTLHEIEPLLRSQGRLIRLPPHRTAVFAGDTHGDLDATERIFARYLSTGAVIVFLGDAVDRGPWSRENLLRILSAKCDHPGSIHLLMGNHEAWDVARFTPADFWENLGSEERSTAAVALRGLPFAAWHPAGILALHGALPDVGSIEDIGRVRLGSPPWRDITWGDWSAAEVDAPGNAATGRPTYGARTFAARSGVLRIRVLVRSHQPGAPTYLFGDRCMTVFTSSAYGGTTPHVAVLPTGSAVQTARDLQLERI